MVPDFIEISALLSPAMRAFNLATIVAFSGPWGLDDPMRIIVYNEMAMDIGPTALISMRSLRSQFSFVEFSRTGYSILVSV